METKTTIELKKQTKQKLASFGRKDQSYDKLVNEILDFLDTCDRWWAERR